MVSSPGPARLQDSLNRAHAPNHLRCRAGRQTLQDSLRLHVGKIVQFPESGSARRRQPQRRRSRILARRLPLQQPIALEFRENAAQIGWIDLQFRGYCGRPRIRPGRQFVEHASFRQAEVAAQNPLIQRPNQTRVHAREAPEDPRIRRVLNRRLCHHAEQPAPDWLTLSTIMLDVIIPARAEPPTGSVPSPTAAGLPHSAPAR